MAERRIFEKKLSELTLPNDFDPKSLAIVTATFYREWYPGAMKPLTDVNDEVVAKVRGDLALQTIGAAVAKGFRLVVIDGADNVAFKDRLKELGAEPRPENKR